MNMNKKGPFITFGYVVYAELFITPIPDLELYFRVANWVLQDGEICMRSYNTGTALVFNTSAGIAWYF